MVLGVLIIGPAPGLDLMFVLSHVPAHTGICNGCVHAQEKHYKYKLSKKACLTSTIIAFM